jgi:hypothetical protein
MTVRKADEAQLSDDAKNHRSVRIKVAHEGLTTTAEPMQQTAAKEGPETTGDPMQGVATDDHLADALTYVDIPTPHPLDIHGWHSDIALGNLNQSQRAMWIDAENPKVLAYRAYGGRIEDRSDVLKARDVIKSALDLEKHPIVAIPVPDPTTKRDAHLCALIRDIPREKAEELIRRVSPSRETTALN